MNTHSFVPRSISVCITLAAVLVLAGTGLTAQQIPPEVAQWGYTDTIFVNGKVVSMDDASTSTSVGNVYQAIAVKDDRIVKLGTDQEARALAGPDTKVFDLKGKTLLPGIVEPHSHIYGRATGYLDRFGFKYPPDGIVVSAQADRDLEKTQAIMRDTIQDAVKKVTPASGWSFRCGLIRKHLPILGSGG